jgi:hypothetical protein
MRLNPFRKKNVEPTPQGWAFMDALNVENGNVSLEWYLQDKAYSGIPNGVLYDGTVSLYLANQINDQLGLPRADAPQEQGFRVTPANFTKIQFNDKNSDAVQLPQTVDGDFANTELPRERRRISRKIRKALELGTINDQLRNTAIASEQPVMKAYTGKAGRRAQRYLDFLDDYTPDNTEDTKRADPNYKTIEMLTVVPIMDPRIADRPVNKKENDNLIKKGLMKSNEVIEFRTSLDNGYSDASKVRYGLFDDNIHSQIAFYEINIPKLGIYTAARAIVINPTALANTENGGVLRTDIVGLDEIVAQRNALVNQYQQGQPDNMNNQNDVEDANVDYNVDWDNNDDIEEDVDVPTFTPGPYQQPTQANIVPDPADQYNDDDVTWDLNPPTGPYAQPQVPTFTPDPIQGVVNAQPGNEVDAAAAYLQQTPQGPENQGYIQPQSVYNGQGDPTFAPQVPSFVPNSMSETDEILGDPQSGEAFPAMYIDDPAQPQTPSAISGDPVIDAELNTWMTDNQPGSLGPLPPPEPVGTPVTQL